jgi:hypothetical protein
MASTTFSGPVTSTAGFVGDISISTAITQLTDNSGGTASDTIAAIGATYSQTEVANAVASLAAKIDEILTALGQ